MHGESLERPPTTSSWRPSCTLGSTLAKRVGATARESCLGGAGRGSALRSTTGRGTSTGHKVLLLLSPDRLRRDSQGWLCVVRARHSQVHAGTLSSRACALDPMVSQQSSPPPPTATTPPLTPGRCRGLLEMVAVELIRGWMIGISCCITPPRIIVCSCWDSYTAASFCPDASPGPHSRFQLWKLTSRIHVCGHSQTEETRPQIVIDRASDPWDRYSDDERVFGFRISTETRFLFC